MISQLFTDLDTDGSGTVDIHEFLHGLQQIGLEGTRPPLALILPVNKLNEPLSVFGLKLTFAFERTRSM